MLDECCPTFPQTPTRVHCLTRQIGTAKKLRLRLEYLGARIVLAACSLFPLAPLREAGAALGWFAYRVIRIRRRVTLQNIMDSLPELSRSEASHIGLESYKNFGRSMMEFSAFQRMSGQRFWEMTTVEGHEHPKAALAHGRGGIIITGHLGNWELLGAGIAREGFPVHGSDTRHTNELTHRIIKDLRGRQGVKVLDPEQSVASMLRLLANNQFVAYLPDQDAGRSGVFVEFFGRPASTRRSPAILSLRAGCPIIPVFIARERPDRHHIIYRELIWPDPTRRGRDSVVDITQRYTRMLEEMVRRYPETYFWMHRRWKTKQPGPQP